MQTSNFHHTGNIGDVWASIPSMRQHYFNTGKKINLYLEKDVHAEYYEGAVHPTKNSDGATVMLNEKMIEMMLPLLAAQDWMNEVKVWENEPIDVHLSWFRDTQMVLPNFSINRWYFYIFPQLTTDLSQVWLQVPETDKDLAKGKILITRSERYHGDDANYEFLKPYEDDCIFCGTMREYNQFCMSYDLNIRKLNISNFLELAQAIKQSKFHITNQTQAFQLSEGQKHPRILEVCKFAPNCIPIGEKAYDFHFQLGLECSFHTLNGTIDVFNDKLKNHPKAVSMAEKKMEQPITQ